MKASEFINTFAFATLAAMNGRGQYACMDVDLEDIYQEIFFYLPRIRCKDGFSISVQVNNGNYCSSENGTRTFGYEWQEVEWGFPSEDIDEKKYNAESSPTTETVGGYVEIGLIDELIEEHGGLDLMATLTKAYEK